MNKAIAYAGIVVLTLTGIIRVLASDVGREWGVERESYADPVTGIQIWEMTKTGSASDNLYFHFSNFSADNRYLVFVSDRTGSTQLFRTEVETGHIVQLTDDAAVNARSACLDHANARRIYYLRGPEVVYRTADGWPACAYSRDGGPDSANFSKTVPITPTTA